MSIKKAFVPIVEFLESNKNSKVSTILDQVKQLCASKSAGGGSAFVKNAEGIVTHIFCYYHKMWEPVNADGSVSENDKTHCEYGKKANTVTGLNSMCKVGTSAWTKQQREAKNASATLLTDVAGGKVKPADILKKQEEIDSSRKTITPRADKLGSKDQPKAA